MSPCEKCKKRNTDRCSGDNCYPLKDWRRHMGRSMVVNKKRMPATQNDLKRAEDRLNKKLEEHKAEAAARGTKAAFGLMFLAINHLYGWKWQAYQKIQGEVDRMADEVAAGRLSWDDIIEELRSIGIGLDI